MRAAASRLCVLVAITLCSAVLAANAGLRAQIKRGPVTDVLILDARTRLEVSVAGVDRVEERAGETRRRAFARPDHRVVAAARLDSRVVLVGGLPAKRGVVTVHAADGTELSRQRLTDDILHAVAITEGRVAVGSADGRVLLLRVVAEAPFLKQDREVTGHAGGTHAVAFAPDGRALASAGQNGLVLIHDLGDASSGGSPTVLSDHRAPVLSVSFRDDGAEVASSAADGALRVHATSGRLRRSWLGLGRDLRAVRWWRGNLVVVAGDGRVRVCARASERTRVIGEPGRALFSLEVVRATEGTDRALVGTWNRVLVFALEPLPGGGESSGPAGKQRRG